MWSFSLWDTSLRHWRKRCHEWPPKSCSFNSQPAHDFKKRIIFPTLLVWCILWGPPGHFTTVLGRKLVGLKVYCLFSRPIKFIFSCYFLFARFLLLLYSDVRRDVYSMYHYLNDPLIAKSGMIFLEMLRSRLYLLQSQKSRTRLYHFFENYVTRLTYPLDKIFAKGFVQELILVFLLH